MDFIFPLKRCSSSRGICEKKKKSTILNVFWQSVTPLITKVCSISMVRKCTFKKTIKNPTDGIEQFYHHICFSIKSFWISEK